MTLCVQDCGRDLLRHLGPLLASSLGQQSHEDRRLKCLKLSIDEF